jgi:uroporphyrinogen-III synthase
MTPLLVLRPEPGNSATAERARSLGLHAIQRPLFEIEPVAWTAPDVDAFDYLLLTSANALRLGGAQLEHLKALTALAVGPATGVAAQEAGFRVERVGEGGVDELLGGLPAGTRVLHLTGVDHHRPGGGHSVVPLSAYRTVPLSPEIPDGPLVALIHSARAGTEFARLVRDRSRVTIAALSAAAAAACGTGWRGCHYAEKPDEAALLALAARLCHD